METQNRVSTGVLDSSLLWRPVTRLLPAKEDEHGLHCAITALLGKAQEGGPKETAQSCVRCSPVHRDKAEVGQL